MREMRNCLLKFGFTLLAAFISISLSASTTHKLNSPNSPNFVTPPIAFDDTLSTRAKTLLTFRPVDNDIVNGTLSALTIIKAPKYGSIGFLALDTLIYMPVDGFCGKDTLYYQICNELFQCDTAMIEITVGCLGQEGDSGLPPSALDDIAFTQMNTSVEINVLGNDSLRSILVKPLSITGAPHNGIVWVSNNRVIYLPNNAFCGIDTFMYDVCNVNGCDTAWAFVYVDCNIIGNNNRNQPLAFDDTYSIKRNEYLFIRPTVNDTLNGTLSSVSIVNPAKHGSIAFSSVDSLVYIPQMGYCGGDTINYRVCNQLFLCDTATIFINIACTDDSLSGNQLPIAVNDVSTIEQGKTISVAVLTNDTINPLLNKPVTIVRAAQNGSASVVMNEIKYIPNASFCGNNDTIAYEICNRNGCDTAELIITVNCKINTDNGVIALDDSFTTDRNVNIKISPSLNDTLNGDLLGISIIEAPRNGSIGFLGIDTILYAPQRRYCGNDTIIYRICRTDLKCDSASIFITVNCTPESERPDALDDIATTLKNTALKINVAQNDANNGSITLPLSIVRQPKYGTASFDTLGYLDYIPTMDSCGVNDTLTYTLCNEFGCDTASVFINIICEQVILPEAIDDEATIFKNTSVEVNVLANDDLHGQRLDNIVIIKEPSNGISTLLNRNIRYAPNQDFCNANDTVEYAICTRNGCDTAKLIINIACKNRYALLPKARKDTAIMVQAQHINIPILQNDSTFAYPLELVYLVSSPKHGTAKLATDNTVTYTPIPSFCSGVDSFKYALCTARGCDTTSVYIIVACDLNKTSKPIAMPDMGYTLRNTEIGIDILPNDTLFGADTLRIIRFPKRGTANIGISKELYYQPDAIFCNGIDSIVYEVCNLAGCDTALVTIVVGCDSSSLIMPTANFDAAKTDINKSIKIPAFSNDTLRGALLREVSIQPKNGVASVSADNQIIYIPHNEFWGRDTFTYIICNLAGCDTAMVYVSINPGNNVVVYNAFSPNGDNVNDKLIIRGIDNFPNNEVAIYNRWGNEIFRKKGYNNDDPWDGLWDGNLLLDGTYFYIIHLNDAKNQKLSGYIQVHK